MEAPSPGGLRERVRQSPPVNIARPYNPDWLKNKTILITGAASGFGAAFATKWAAHGATLILGDINVSAGDKLARHLRKETKSERIHFLHCDVTDWASQVNFFREAAKLSPHGGIDVVVPNAGVAGSEPLEFVTRPPADLMSGTAPPAPNLGLINVNLIGVLYSCYLAFWYLPRNPGSVACDPRSNPDNAPRDRQILLIASVAGLGPVPGAPLYATSKHAVMGLFRTLRGQSFVHGVRVNALCPYFVDTPIMPYAGKLLLAGAGWGSVGDVVDAGTRLVADSRILGRALVIGPKGTIVQDEHGGHMIDLPAPGPEGQPSGVWEAYAEDYELSEVFLRRITAVISAVAAARGVVGMITDIIRLLTVGFFGLIFGRWKR